jgi:hypothetical protein
VVMSDASCSWRSLAQNRATGLSSEPEAAVIKASVPVHSGRRR